MNRRELIVKMAEANTSVGTLARRMGRTVSGVNGWRGGFLPIEPADVPIILGALGYVNDACVARRKLEGWAWTHPAESLGFYFVDGLAFDADPLVSFFDGFPLAADAWAVRVSGLDSAKHYAAWAWAEAYQERHGYGRKAA